MCECVTGVGEFRKVRKEFVSRNVQEQYLRDEHALLMVNNFVRFIKRTTFNSTNSNSSSNNSNSATTATASTTVAGVGECAAAVGSVSFLLLGLPFTTTATASTTVSDVEGVVVLHDSRTSLTAPVPLRLLQSVCVSVSAEECVCVWLRW